MKDQVSLDQKLEYKGYWYLPSSPEKKIAGNLTYYPNEKIVLELFGGFNTSLSALFNSNSSKNQLYMEKLLMLKKLHYYNVSKM